MPGSIFCDDCGKGWYSFGDLKVVKKCPECGSTNLEKHEMTYRGQD